MDLCGIVVIYGEHTQGLMPGVAGDRANVPLGERTSQERAPANEVR